MPWHRPADGIVAGGRRPRHPPRVYIQKKEVFSDESKRHSDAYFQPALGPWYWRYGCGGTPICGVPLQGRQAYWQILPICPTSYGDSPYQSFSTFAGNPYFIDLDELCQTRPVLPEEYENIDWESAPDTINYGVLYEKRYKVLRCAANRLLAKPNAAYRKFVKENAFWLPDYALFMALKDAHGGACWLEWEEPLRRREPEALKAARRASTPTMWLSGRWCSTCSTPSGTR